MWISPQIVRWRLHNNRTIQTTTGQAFQFEIVRGGAGNDIITANDADNQLFGNDGDDEIHGGKGLDLIVGGPGNNNLFGDAGDDSYNFQNSVGVQTNTVHEGSWLGQRWWRVERRIGYFSSTGHFVNGDIRSFCSVCCQVHEYDH